MSLLCFSFYCNMIENGIKPALLEINQNLSFCCCCRYNILAKQYKAMYPTLEIDIEGELTKLKV